MYQDAYPGHPRAYRSYKLQTNKQTDTKHAHTHVKYWQITMVMMISRYNFRQPSVGA